MEYVAGQDLARLLRRLGTLPVADACELARQAALALDYVHRQGLVHRDVKPSNLILSDQGQLKLLDLGLAAWNESPEDGELTASGQLLGTVDYLAPEQASGGEVDIRADVYALGATLYKLLTGRTPRDDRALRTTAQKLAALATAEPVPLDQLREDVPAELSAVVARMLARRPQDRFADPPLAAGHDLLRLATAGGPVPTERRAVRPAPQPSRRRSRAGLVLGGLLVVGLAYGVWLVVRDRDGREVGRLKLPPGGSIALELEPPGADRPPAPVEKSPLDQWPLRARGAALDQVGAEVPLVAELGDSRLTRSMGVTRVAYSSHGAILAVASHDRQVQLHDAQDGRLLQSLRGHRGAVTDLAFHPLDRQRLASCDGQDVLVWNTDTGQAEGRIELAAQTLAYLPGGQRLVAGAQRSVHLVDLPGGEVRLVHADHTDLIHRVAASGDGRWLASAGADQTIRIWTADGQGQPRVLPVEGHVVRDLAFDAGGRLLAAAGDGGLVAVWEVASGERLHSLHESGTLPRPARRSSDGSGEGKRLLGDPGPTYLGVAFDAEGGRLAAVSQSSWDGGRLQVWDLATGPRQEQELVVRGNGVTAVAWQPGGQKLALGTGAEGARPGQVACFDLGKGGIAWPMAGHWHECNSVEFSPDGRRLYSVGNDRTLREWNLETLETRRAVRIESGIISAVAASAEGRWVAVSCRDGQVRLLDAHSLTEVLTFAGGDWGTHMVDFSPDGALLAVGGKDSLSVWHTATGGLAWRHDVPLGEFYAVAFAPGGRTLASGGPRHTVKIWDAATGRLEHTHSGFGGWAVGLDYSDGGRLLLAECAGEVKLRDAESGKVLGRVRPDGTSVEAMAIDSAGRHLAVAGRDGAVTIWDLATQRQLHRYPLVSVLDAKQKPILALAYSPEGRHLAAALANGSIYLLRTTEKLPPP
jgi:WD40 repeat protein